MRSVREALHAPAASIAAATADTAHLGGWAHSNRELGVGTLDPDTGRKCFQLLVSRVRTTMTLEQILARQAAWQFRPKYIRGGFWSWYVIDAVKDSIEWELETRV